MTRLAAMRFLTALVVPLLAVAACSHNDPSPPPVDVVGAWVLDSGIQGGAPVPMVDGHRITLTIEPDGSAGGTSACNSYGGRVNLAGDRIRFRDMAGTDMGCEQDVMGSETAYLRALGAIETAMRDGDRLVLIGPDSQLEFSKLAPVPQADVVDTVWILESLLLTDVAVGAVGEPATLVFGSDGTLRGSTGCRRLTGTYSVSGDEILATQLSVDGDCPAELAAQDEQVVTVIGDAFMATVDGDLLTLSARGNQGLVYRAQAEDS
jgi:heat shock protein HslJ